MPSDLPLVSIVTPTKLGREPLVEQVHRSVLEQDWRGEIEHVLIADHLSPLEAFGWGETQGVRLYTLGPNWRNGVREKSVGAIPWMVGTLLAQGRIIGFCGDDDQLLPDHVRRHVVALQQTQADFTISPVAFHVGGAERFVIGDGSFEHGHLDADGIMCRSEALRVANWTATGEDAADHRLVRDWLAGGLKGHFIGGSPTAIHHDGWAAG
jgi:hypothetical protein